MSKAIFLIILGIFLVSWKPGDQKMKTFELVQIGEVIREDGHTYIDIEEKYRDALLGMDQFSEITVIYWFDRNDNAEGRSVLQVHPRGNPVNPVRGVFTTHSPARPNLLGISRCKILSVSGCRIGIEYIDAWDHSPVVDIKN